MTLSVEDRALVTECRREIMETPLPANNGPLGCLAGIAGLIMLVAWPRVLAWVPALGFFTPFVMLAGVLAVAGGPVFSFFGGHSSHATARAAIESALRVLEDPASDREMCLRAATLMLTRAWVSTGPSTDLVLEPGPARERVGSRIEMVRAVEAHLEETVNAIPVFADAASGDEMGA